MYLPLRMRVVLCSCPVVCPQQLGESWRPGGPSPWRRVAAGGTREGPSEQWPPKGVGPRGEAGCALRDWPDGAGAPRSEGWEQGGASGCVCAAGALLEKKVDMDKRGLGVTDYNGMVTKPLGCRPPISKESSVDRPAFLDKVGRRAFVCL